MQPVRRGALLLASLSMCSLALTGCHHDNGTDLDGTGHPVINGTNAVATVDGTPITQQQFFTQLQNYVPPQNPQMPTPTEAAGQAVLRQMITDVIVEKYAQQQGAAPTDAEVNALYQTKQLVQEAQSVKSFDDLLAQSGETPDDFKEWNIRPQLAQIKLFAKGQPAVTDTDIQTFYDKNKTQFTEPNRAHIKRIVLSSASDAARIADQIKKGQPFESFASQSLDRQFPGGDVPVWVNLDVPASASQIVPQDMIKLINKAQPGNGPGSVVGPYAFHGVFWVVQVVDKQPKKIVSADQVKDLIRFELLSQRAAANAANLPIVRQQLVAYQSKAKITIPDKRYANLLAQITAPPPPTPPLGTPGTTAPTLPTAAPKPGG